MFPVKVRKGIFLSWIWNKFLRKVTSLFVKFLIDLYVHFVTEMAKNYQEKVVWGNQKRVVTFSLAPKSESLFMPVHNSSHSRFIFIKWLTGKVITINAIFFWPIEIGRQCVYPPKQQMMNGLILTLNSLNANFKKLKAAQISTVACSVVAALEACYQNGRNQIIGGSNFELSNPPGVDTF